MMAVYSGVGITALRSWLPAESEREDKKQITGKAMITNKDYRALGSSVILQAFRDLKDDNLLKALDALLWLISDCPLWLDGLGFDYDPVQLLTTSKFEEVKFGKKQRA